MNALTQSVFSNTAPCMPCCVTPTDCACAILIPPFGSPYPDYASAAAVVSDPLAVSNCILFFQDSSGFISALAAVDSGTDVSVTGTFSSPVNAFGDSWLSFSVLSGETFSIAYTGGANIQFRVYDCTGTELEFVSSGTSPAVSSSVPSDGVYYLKVTVFNPPGPGSPFTSASFTVTPSGAYVVNPVIALWDDSGTTRQLEACPKLYLPILTESTGTWYASCSDAHDAIDLHASNCVGYSEQVASGSFVATDGGTSLTLEDQGTTGPSYALGLWGSVNALVGETLSISFGTTNLTSNAIKIYDQSGTLVETLTGLTSPLVSSALPYSGRYTVKCESLYSASTLNTYVITSSGAMSVNPIQAFWDSGLACPAHLDCGDSC